MMSSPAPVPDILLSQAKDDRYISQVSSLLSQIASVCVFPLCNDGGRRNNNNISRRRRRRSSSGGGGAQSTSATTTTTTSSIQNHYYGVSDDDYEDDDHRQNHFIHLTSPELNLLASIIVHSSAFFCYYNRAPTNNNNEKRSTLGMESLNLVYRMPATMKRKELPYSSKSISLMQRFRKASMGVILPSSLWNVTHFQRMMFVQTIVPYILQRVSRGGWKEDLRALIPARSEGIIHDIGEDERSLRNDDNLRGSARRRLFDQQRRQMLQLASASTRNANNGNHNDSEVENENANPSIATFNSSATDQSATLLSPMRNENNDDWRLTTKIATLCWDSLKKIALATSSLSHGAHSLPSRHDISTAATNHSLDRTTKIIQWFLRLHLALFYWNGLYPTVLHRLAGGIIASDQIMSGETVVANRPTYKPVAAIILFQAGIALARGTAEASVELAHFVQIAFFRWRRRRGRQTEQQHSGSGCRTQNTANTERAEYMDLIEEHVPGIGSSNNTSSKLCPTITKTKDPNQYTIIGTTTTGLPCCGICLNERVHPSVPSVCGHVFCWSCILHWVSNVRAECPLCRAVTRRQDIIPLYNYP